MVSSEKLLNALSAAGRIQRHTLPKEQPDFKGYDIHGSLSSYYKIGGDFYDFLPHGDKLGIAVADVVGKGLEAALVSSSMHASLHAFSHTNHNRDVVEIVRNVDDFLLEHTDDHTYATLVYGELNPDGRFDYCIAGHEPPIVCSNGRAMVVHQPNFSRANTVLGMFSDADFKDLIEIRGYDLFSLRLKKGDVLVLYSDGLVDSMGEKGEQVLSDLVAQNHLRSAEQISEEVFAYLQRFRKIDDQTLVVVKRV
jgi:sigma-B regulation protein RsbU (phosphoserine phosphatase)